MVDSTNEIMAKDDNFQVEKPQEHEVSFFYDIFENFIRNSRLSMLLSIAIM